MIRHIGPTDAASVEDAIRRGATRRELLAWLGAAGMGAAMAGTVIGGATRALAEAPKRGGKVRIAAFATATTDTLDPPKGSNSTDYSRHTMFYNGLTYLDASLAPQLELAESIEHDKAMVWTIKLRKGVRFHDGSPFTAADVVYSLGRHKDPAVASKAKALADQIAEVKATGSHEVQIRLVAPNADLPVIFGVSHFLIVKDGTTDFRLANGTGPYKCKEFSPGIRSIAVRNDEYWQPGKPYLDEIEFFGIPDGAARVNALLSGDVQGIMSVPPTSVRQVQASPGLKMFETRLGTYTDLVMRVDAVPGNNPDFVLAMKYMLDRQQMKTAVLRNFGMIGNDHPIDPTNRYYNADLLQRPYDLDKAKFHLNKAGMAGSSFPVTVSPAATNSEAMAQILQQSAKSAGLNLELRRVPADGYWTNQWMKQPLGFGSINARPSADLVFSLFFKSDAAWNELGWKNEKFDQLLVAARGEPDEAKRKRMYGDMQQIVHEHCGIGIPIFNSALDAHVEKLKGLTPIPLGNFMGYNFADKIWLDA